MEVRTFDILVLFALAILIGVVISYYVIDNVNKKLSNIMINMPQPVCPQPRIILRGLGGDIDLPVVSLEKGKPTHQDNLPDNNKGIEGFSDLVFFSDSDNIVDPDAKPCPEKKEENPQPTMRSPGINCGIPVKGQYDLSTMMVTADGRLVNNIVNMYIPQAYMGGDDQMSGFVNINSDDSSQSNPINVDNLLGLDKKIESIQPYNE